MLNEQTNEDNRTLDELDGLISLNDLSIFDMGKYTVQVFAGTDRLYKFKNDRPSKLMETMANHRRENRFCDVILRVKGEQHPAHKIVLASASSYFESMFGEARHIEAQTTSAIDLTKLVPCTVAMNVILEFLYTSQVQLNDKIVMPVLTCSIPLLLDDLIEICVAFLREQLHPSNCVGLLLYGKQYLCEPLIEAAKQYIFEHFEDVVRHEEFLSLNFTDLCSMIKDDKIKVTCESIIYNVRLEKRKDSSYCFSLRRLCNGFDMIH